MSDSVSGTHSSRSSPGDPASTGSYRTASKSGVGSGPLAAEQATVISNQPPLSRPSHSDGLGPPRPEHLVPGACLGQFEVLEYVGGGGMGHVYRATDKALGRMVALKVLSTDQVVDPDTLLRFRNEARSAARLNHENIVQVYYAGEEQGVSYIAFEFVEGINTRQLVEQKGALSLPEALSYTLQIAEALDYASQQNVVHRDIKPSNVLITPEGRAKLIDMGLARLQGPKGEEDLTASGVTLGTFDYISPNRHAIRATPTYAATSIPSDAPCSSCWRVGRRFPRGPCSRSCSSIRATSPPTSGSSDPTCPKSCRASCAA